MFQVFCSDFRHPATDLIKKICEEAADFCKQSEVDISKLAMHFSLENKDIPTTLCSTASLKRAMENIKSNNNINAWVKIKF